MVAAGIYMLCRIQVLMVPDALNIIMVIGAVTALYAALCAITQRDIKKVLAYSTLSQLGYMVAAFGLGSLASGHAEGPQQKVVVIAGVGAVMLYALLTRTLLDVNVLHDRNPVAVRLSDGSIRNAYTVRLLNKRGFDRVIAIDVDGPANATVHVVGADSVTQDRPMIILGRDQTTELRLLVTAPSEGNPDKSMPVHFHVTDIGLGEVASTTDNFVTP